jgi:hypothetical protein
MTWASITTVAQHYPVNLPQYVHCTWTLLCYTPDSVNVLTCSVQSLTFTWLVSGLWHVLYSWLEIVTTNQEQILSSVLLIRHHSLAISRYQSYTPNANAQTRSKYGVMAGEKRGCVIHSTCVWSSIQNLIAPDCLITSLCTSLHIRWHKTAILACP